MKSTIWRIGALVLIAAFVGACEQKSAESKDTKGTPTADASGRCTHEIKIDKCPFCKPELIEADGFCAEHGVAEALCYQCRPYLKAAFRAKGDWCEQHKAPDSQCVQCHPELKDKMKPGAGHGHGATAPSAEAPALAAGQCEHRIEQARCPFCTPSLVASEGFCKEHNIAEALCVKCRPYLEAAFKAKGDWCAEHGTPESQCAACNPELKDSSPPAKS